MILALSYVAVGAVTLAVMLWCGAVLVEPGPMAPKNRRDSETSAGPVIPDSLCRFFPL